MVRLRLPRHVAHAVLTRNAIPGYFWLPQLASFFFLFGYNETVKWFIRNRPASWVAKHLQW
jgi:hypothetical protein